MRGEIDKALCDLGSVSIANRGNAEIVNALHEALDHALEIVAEQREVIR